jgi:broad specificity phosphatase PhoE
MVTDMIELYFVRHGESEDNARRIWARFDAPLTELGRKQAREAARKLRDQGVRFDLVVVSPMPRALQTAHIIAGEIGHDSALFDINDLFVERGWGELTGTSNEGYYASGKTLADIDDAPGAEKLAQMHARAERALEYLKARPEERILVVGHGAFARALRRVINGEPHTNEYAPDLVRYQNSEIARLI